MKRLSNEDFDDLLESRRPALFKGYDLTAPQAKQLGALKQLLSAPVPAICPSIAQDVGEREKVRQAAKQARIKVEQDRLLVIEQRMICPKFEQLERARNRRNNTCID